MAAFHEKVNTISNVITSLSPDPAERVGLVEALRVIYQNELKKYLTPMAPPAQGGSDAEEATSAGAAAGAAE